MAGTVIFLGAGATKACGGPLTNEILPAILADAPASDPAGRLPRLHQFLQDQFHISANSPPESYPGLPMLMSLLDTALDRRQAFQPRKAKILVALLRIEFRLRLAVHLTLLPCVR